MRPSLGRRVLAASTVAYVALAAHPVAAQPTIFSTGVNSAGAPLSAGAPDPHYQVLISGSPQAVTVSFIPPTYVTSPTSAWIWQQTDGAPVNVTRTFRTTFDLTGYSAGTARVAGQWAVDNYGLDILINGTSTGITNFNQFGSFTNFAIGSGFVPGLNTIDFVVQDVGAVSGLNVANVTVTASPTAVVPEPSTYALLAAGLAGVGTVARRRRQAHSA